MVRKKSGKQKTLTIWDLAETGDLMEILRVVSTQDEAIPLAVDKEPREITGRYPHHIHERGDIVMVLQKVRSIYGNFLEVLTPRSTVEVFFMFTTPDHADEELTIDFDYFKLISTESLREGM